MSESIAIENVLAAYMDSIGGVIRIPREYLEKDYVDKALSLDFDHRSNTLIITIIDKEDTEYEDE